MRPIKPAIALLSLLPLLQACGGDNSEDGKVTETRMDDLDSIEGTISDEPVNMDANTDEAPIDPSAPAAAKAKSTSNDKAKSGDETKAKMSPVEAAPPSTAKISPDGEKKAN